MDKRLSAFAVARPGFRLLWGSGSLGGWRRAVGSKSGNHFSIDLRGGASPDPKAAVAKIKDYWKSKNWTIETIIDHADAPNPSMQIAATSPTGILVVYNAIKNNTNPERTTGWSSLTVESDCTLDPSLNGVPTPKTSPPGTRS